MSDCGSVALACLPPHHQPTFQWTCQVFDSYGPVEIDKLATHFALLLGENSETVQGELSTLKSYLARRPEAEPWPKTYSALKVICAANPELMPTQEVLLDII